MSIIKSGKLWPFAISLGIAGVFGLCIWTIAETQKAHIQESDAYMTSYQDADLKANEFIKSRIAFDKKYKLKYVTDKLSENGCDVKYKLTTLDGKAVKDAKMVLSISRPETKSYNKTVENPVLKDDLYVFNDLKFPKAGAWNLLLKVNVGNNSRFYSVRTDTRIHHDRSVEEAATY